MSDIDDIDETIAQTEAVLEETRQNGANKSATDDNTEQTDRATAAGESVGDGAREASANALARFLIGLLSVVPFRQRLVKKLMLGGMYKYYKMSGGDAMGLRARPNGKIEPAPVKWMDGLEAVEDAGDGGPDRPGWKVKGEEQYYGPGAEGRNVDWFGKTPVILLDDDNPERWETLDARISECLEDPSRTDAVFEDATVSVTGVIDQRAYNPGGSDGEDAVADGGSPVQDQYDVIFGEIARGRLADKLIDPSSPDGADGMRVSFRKVQEQRFEQTTTEEMHNQEVRGYLAGKAGGNHEELLKKLALYFILGVLGLLAIVFLGPPIVGGESITPSLSVMPPVGGVF